MGQPTEVSHLEMVFLKDSPSGKTKIWEVRNVTLDETLGTIGWNGGWRKYVYKSPEAVYDARCLRDIAWMLDRAKDDYNDTRKS